jgi:hypothetical protein
MQKEQNKNNTKKFNIKYTHIMQNPYNKTVEEKKLLHILWVIFKH